MESLWWAGLEEDHEEIARGRMPCGAERLEGVEVPYIVLLEASCQLAEKESGLGQYIYGRLDALIPLMALQLS